MFNLAGKVVFITGASAGIGRACAVTFHCAGARVVGIARRREKLESLRAELGDNRVVVVEADVTRTDQRAQALETARRQFGRIDVLVNNAGWASFGSLQNVPTDHIRRMVDLNLEAPIALIQDVLPEMLRRRSGQIVNVSSVLAIQAVPQKAVYCATKAALTSLSTALRLELRGSGVDVIVVSPGTTATEFFDTVALPAGETVSISKRADTAEHVAERIVRACRFQRREVTLTSEGRIISVVRRFSHRVADGIVYRVSKGRLRRDS